MLGKGSVAAVAKVNKQSLGVLPHQTDRDASRAKLVVANIAAIVHSLCPSIAAVIHETIVFARARWEKE